MDEQARIETVESQVSPDQGGASAFVGLLVAGLGLAVLCVA